MVLLLIFSPRVIISMYNNFIRVFIMKNSTLLNLLVISTGLVVSACNGGGGGGSSSPQSQAKALPAGYQCNPSNYPSNSSPNSLQIAYAANCSVESAVESANLQQLAVALDYYRNDNQFGRYCTGTPIYKNPTTGVYFIVTAAHCVVGTTTQKAAGSAITANNVSTFVTANGHNSAWVYQGTNPMVAESSGLTGQIVAVYVNSQYCQNPAFAFDPDAGTYECPNDQLTQMNGDVAVIKVQTQPGKTINIAPNVKLAPSSFYMSPTAGGNTTNLLVLGYGGTIPDGTVKNNNPDNNYLNYIATQYFGTNSYGGTSAPVTIFNGFFSNNMYYTLICGGDSGGGDFAWDGSNWNLVGIHSWGNTNVPPGVTCGAYMTNEYMVNASADVRQLNGWIQNILNQDSLATGCANLSGTYVCAAGSGQ